jgi:hypothetical protein
VLVAAVWAYSHLQLRWTLFAALFLVPDLSMFGFAINARLGAIFYNLAHTYVLPAALLGFGLVRGTSLQMAVALIWIAHIGFDRLLGYGLKYPTHFKDTHMQRVA